ncbi:MAG TPA: Spy/CpxP family protein refolding chaperone [Ramlibacter sp.]|nr:Spy/CpxP family protein refolding chaperone [Ramlibacter sp.]
MKPRSKQLLASALLAGFGLAAIAQMPPSGPPGPGAGGAPGQHMQQGKRMDPAKFEEMRKRRTEQMAKRMADLKQKLALAPAQEGAWTAWTTAMQPPAQPHQRPDRAEFEKLTTPERIDRMRARRAQHQSEMDKRMEATKTFYAALNADQKKVFDAESMRFMRGGRHGGGHGGGHHRG